MQSNKCIFYVIFAQQVLANISSFTIENNQNEFFKMKDVLPQFTGQHGDDINRDICSVGENTVSSQPNTEPNTELNESKKVEIERAGGEIESKVEIKRELGQIESKVQADNNIVQKESNFVQADNKIVQTDINFAQSFSKKNRNFNKIFRKKVYKSFEGALESAEKIKRLKGTSMIVRIVCKIMKKKYSKQFKEEKRLL